MLFLQTFVTDTLVMQAVFRGYLGTAYLHVHGWLLFN